MLVQVTYPRFAGHGEGTIEIFDSEFQEWREPRNKDELLEALKELVLEMDRKVISLSE
jgi:hypothetical protein